MSEKYWLCGEFYPGSGRLARPWVERGEERPDAYYCIGEGCKFDHGGGFNEFAAHTPYPFNGMGGKVIDGPFASEAEAWAALEE